MITDSSECHFTLPEHSGTRHSTVCYLRGKFTYCNTILFGIDKFYWISEKTISKSSAQHWTIEANPLAFLSPSVTKSVVKYCPSASVPQTPARRNAYPSQSVTEKILGIENIRRSPLLFVVRTTAASHGWLIGFQSDSAIFPHCFAYFITFTFLNTELITHLPHSLKWAKATDVCYTQILATKLSM